MVDHSIDAAQLELFLPLTTQVQLQIHLLCYYAIYVYVCLLFPPIFYSFDRLRTFQNGMGADLPDED